MRILIIANRLPVKVTEEDGRYQFHRSEGGLATGLGSLQTRDDIVWLGWPGLYPGSEAEKNTIRGRLKNENFHPVFLTPEHIRDFYEGYSNNILWPLCHYFYYFIQYQKAYWEAYKEVNNLYCQAAARLIREGDFVWVQDYQLMLLPGMLREKFPNLSIGYFHHIPFPSYELFRVLPERAELLKGLLGADLVGFHTHDYMRHFISAAYRVLGLDCNLDEIDFSGRRVHVDTFPMGINFQLYFDSSENEIVQDIAVEFKTQFGGSALVLSVDRLDYSKGILQRLKGFGAFLDNYPEYRNRVSLVMVVVPSRENVDTYTELKAKIDETIGGINGKHSTLNWQPVYYFYRSLSFEELIAMYHIADIAMVTPLRDGMNLVAKEYVAAKRHQPGVLILSEMTGAAIELKDALIINPNNIDEIEMALHQAMIMPLNERMDRLRNMQKIVARQDIKRWTADFIDELGRIKEKSGQYSDKQLGDTSIEAIRNSYLTARRRLIILDYDGTLVPLVRNPLMASPNDRLLALLDTLSKDPFNHIVINSGRDADILEQWLGSLNLTFVAEHGAFCKIDGRWHENVRQPHAIDEEIMRIMNYITEKTPGSHIETKRFSVVWHYRNCDAWLAELRQKQMVDALIMPCARQNLQIMRGNKVVEIKPQDIHKGIEVERILSRESFDFILSMGDDVTDEDIFRSLPPEAITIKVGSFSDHARYSVQSHEDSLKLLESFVR